MKLSSCPVALMLSICALPAAVQAQSSANLYGLIDVYAGRVQNSGAVALKKADNGGMTTSYLGFKGVEDLGSGWSALFVLESYVRADVGAAARSATDAFFARNAYVGIQGPYGVVTVGRNTTPQFVSAIRFNAFGSSFGFSPFVRQLFGPQLPLPFYGDTDWNNSIEFSSSTYAGFSFSALAAAGEGNGGRNLGGNILYGAGPLAATLAYQKVRNNNGAALPGLTSQTTFNAGASYDFKVVKVHAQYARIDNDATTAVDTKTTIWGASVTVPVGPTGFVLAQYGNATADLPTSSPTNKKLAVGYDYFLSKRTDVYAVYVGDKTTGNSRGNTLGLGVRHRF